MKILWKQVIFSLLVCCLSFLCFQGSGIALDSSKPLPNFIDKEYPKAPIEYPGNLQVKNLLSIQDILKQHPVTIGTLGETKLFTWDEAHKLYGSNSNTIAGDRQIYAIDEIRVKPFPVLHGIMNKGTYHWLVDAETGDFLGSAISYIQGDYKMDKIFTDLFAKADAQAK